MSVQILFFYITSLLLWGASAQVNNGVKLYVLGTAQDAGAPQIGCQKICCSLLREKGETKAVVAMGIIDSKNNRHYLIEASPNLTQQFDTLSDLADANSVFGGIFLTHAHIGHYSGLIYLGKEAMCGNKIPVYAMPRMQKFIKHNAPW